jgi:methyl-accepting chemotaxis protein
LEAAASGFERSAQSVATSLAEAARGLEQRMGSHAEDSTRRLADQFDAMILTLRTLADDSRSMGTASLDSVATRIDSAASSFQGVSERIASALEAAAKQTGGTFDRGATDAVERIVAATEGMRSELQAMLTSVNASIGEAGNAITESGKAGAAVVRDSLGQAGAELAGSVSEAAANLREAGEGASSALRQGGETAGGRIETAGARVADRAEGLSRQVAGLAEVATLLATRIGDLNIATGETARPLTQAAEQLRLVSESMRDAVTPLTGITRRAGDLVELIGVIAQRMDTAQSGASHLIESLDKATLRFEGVDKDLANVLHQLQDGVSRFAADVTRFVTQTDSNLAKASTQVANMVKSLDQSIQDLSDASPREPR